METTGETAARRTKFASLARSHEADLMRLAYRLCRHEEDRAQDLVQDALIRGYEAFLAGRFAPGGNARAWLMRILTNLFINDYRRRRKWDSGLDLDTLTASGEVGPAQTHAAEGDVPGVTLLASLLDEELEAALLKLSEGLRLCVLLVDVQGLDYAEAAAILRVPIGTVRSRLSRARMQLEDLLSEYAQRKRLRP